MFLTSAAGSWLAGRYADRAIIRSGLVVVAASANGMLATIDPELDGNAFGVAMALLGDGMGLIASQLGNVVQSSVDASGRSEAGGLQYTAQQLGSALGVALIGAIVLTGLVNTFVRNVEADERIAPDVAASVRTEVSKGVSFVAADEVRRAASDAGADASTTDALVDDYEDAQLAALKAGLLVAMAIALVSLTFTGGLPRDRPARAGPAPQKAAGSSVGG
jgi:hypothetical protein